MSRRRNQTQERIWVLGAADPEMEMIEALLRECGETVVYAADGRGERVIEHKHVSAGGRRVVYAAGGRGERVTAGTAYRGESLITDVGNHPCTSGVTNVYLVECDLRCEGEGHPELAGRIARHIDHHRPGDPGYGRPPAEFMAASSLGQVIAELARLGVLPRTWRGGYGRSAAPGTIYREPPRDAVSTPWCVVVSECEATHRTTTGRYYDSGWAIEIPADFVLAAAADHCLAAAYRGECPGVDPDSLGLQAAVQLRAAVARHARLAGGLPVTRWTVRWQGEDPALYGCDWPYRRVGTAPITAQDAEDGATEGDPIWEAEVTAPTADAARCAIYGCYFGRPPEVWEIEAVAAGETT